MSKVYLDDSVLTDIADAIREKTGESGAITPANMPTEIESISGGGDDWTDEDIKTFVKLGTNAKVYSKDHINLERVVAPFGSSCYFFIDSNIKIDAPDMRSFTSAPSFGCANEFHFPNFSEIISFSVLSSFVIDIETLENLEILDRKTIGINLSGINRVKKMATPYLTNSNGYCIHGSGNYSTDYYWVEENKASLGGLVNGVGSGVKNLILTSSTMVSMSSAPGSYMPSDITIEHIFVPRTLLESYKTATNWSTYSEGKIVAIEDSEALLKGVFDGLDVLYNWWDGDSLVEKLIRMKLTQEWTITFNELVTIANDLRTNGENSIYWKYKFFPIINKGLLIEEGKYLFVTDVFRYEDSNGNKIPFSCFLLGREEYIKKDTSTKLSPFSTQYAMNSTATNEGGYYASDMRHLLNDSDGALYLEIPSVIRNIAKDFRIDLNDDTKIVKFGILTTNELETTNIGNTYVEQKYYPLSINYINGYYGVVNNISFSGDIALGTANKSTTTGFHDLRGSGIFRWQNMANLPRFVVPTFGI